MSKAYIALERGDTMEGRARVTGDGTAAGEVVFTTAYTGYEESLTDPSYAKQILTFSYPLIGNYGVRPERFESDTVQPAAVIARDLTDDVADWLADEGIPAIDRLDTRHLVTTIRDEGAMRCGIAIGDDVTPVDARDQLESCPAMSDYTDIGASVSIPEPAVYPPQPDGDLGDPTDPAPPTQPADAALPADAPRVALVDCGMKASILDSLVTRGAAVKRFPYDVAADAVRDWNPDLVFLSNGPGDPANFTAAQQLVRDLTEDYPIAGICLGQQIVAEALGGTTEKMDFGHRGVNQPVIDLRTDGVVMTTQNHGYAVADPGPLAVTHRNVNDDTSEGMESAALGILTRQYHPEANPGPHDSLGFFETVLEMAERDDVPPAPMLRWGDTSDTAESVATDDSSLVRPSDD